MQRFKFLYTRFILPDHDKIPPRPFYVFRTFLYLVVPKYFFWKNRENTGVKIIIGKKMKYEKDLLDLISTHGGTCKLLTCRHGELF